MVNKSTAAPLPSAPAKQPSSLALTGERESSAGGRRGVSRSSSVHRYNRGRYKEGEESQDK